MIIVIIASAAPFLGLVISLVGALNISALAIVFPALADICVNWEDGKGGVLLVIKNVLIMLFGILGLLAGTYASLYGIIFKIQEQNKQVGRHLRYVFE